MNYAQARRAVAAKFGDHGLVEHARREKREVQYRVFLKTGGRPVCIGAGSSWRRAVEMAMKAEVTRTPPMPSGAALDAEVATAQVNAVEPVEPEGEKPWAEHAAAAVKTMALNPTFTSDDVWELLDDWCLVRPADSRALGQVMQKLKREGVIRPTGTTVPTRQKSRNRAPIAVWVGTTSK